MVLEPEPLLHQKTSASSWTRVSLDLSGQMGLVVVGLLML